VVDFRQLNFVQRSPALIGVDLAGLIGGRMASAEGGSVPSGVGYGEGCPLSSRLRGLVKRRELPQRGPGFSENGFWRVLKATERSFLYLYDKIWGGTICISVPPLRILGGGLVPLVPRDLRPCLRSEIFNRHGNLPVAT